MCISQNLIYCVNSFINCPWPNEGLSKQYVRCCFEEGTQPQCTHAAQRVRLLAYNEFPFLLVVVDEVTTHYGVRSRTAEGVATYVYIRTVSVSLPMARAARPAQDPCAPIIKCVVGCIRVCTCLLLVRLPYMIDRDRR